MRGRGFFMSDMSEKVISLYGPLPEQHATPDANVVDELERLLEAARAGEIVGIVGSYMHKNGAASYSYAGIVGKYAVIGGLECAKERLLRIALSRDV